MLASQSRAGVSVRVFTSVLHQRRKHLRDKRGVSGCVPFRTSDRVQARRADLSPAAVPADHVRVGHGGEERVRLQVVRQARQELSDVDEVHLKQDVLEQTQDAETRPEQTLLAVPTEDVPDPTRHVQRKRLTVQGEDPGRTQRLSKT